MTTNHHARHAHPSSTADRQPPPPRRDLLATRATPSADDPTTGVLDGEHDDALLPLYDGDQLEREERAALRRVQGLSTELEDVTEVEYRQLRLERVVLAAVWTEGTADDAENSLRELAALAETAGSTVLEGVIQRRQKPDPATYLGKGKAVELRDIVVPRAPTPSSATASWPRASAAPSRTSSRSRSSTARPSSSTSSPSTPRAARARPRSSSPSCSTSCRACVAGVSRCRARPVDRPPAARAWARVVRVRRRSSSTADGSTRASPSSSATSRT